MTKRNTSNAVAIKFPFHQAVDNLSLTLLAFPPQKRRKNLFVAIEAQQDKPYVESNVSVI